MIFPRKKENEKKKTQLYFFLLPPSPLPKFPTPGVPFRETHHLSGAAVKMAEDRGCPLSDLTPSDLRTIHPLFADDVAEVWDFEASAERRDTEGGASKRSVLEQCGKLQEYEARGRSRRIFGKKVQELRAHNGLQQPHLKSMPAAK